MQKNIFVALLTIFIMLFMVGCTKDVQTENVNKSNGVETVEQETLEETEKAEASERTEEQEMTGVEEESLEENTLVEEEEVESDSDEIEETEELEKEHIPATLNSDTVVYAEEEVCTTGSVNIRTEPSTDSEVYRVASRRETFTRTATDGKWSAVTVDGVEYYISNEYLMLASEVTDNGYLVVIDAGHQGQGNHDKEPIGPGASETKAKVASGTTGVATGIPEYQLTLAVSQMLRDELEARGYQVMMIRESHDINISNAERAQVANSVGADAFIRVHANGSDDHSQNGILTICQTPPNPYNGNLYQQCRSLSDYVLDGMINTTGANRKSVWETDSMSGINWCQVPVTIVEMGFMSNPAEDELMATESYRYKLAIGMADGIDAYFNR